MCLWRYAVDTDTGNLLMSTSLKLWFSHTSDYENFEEGVKDADSFGLSIPTTNT